MWRDELELNWDEEACEPGDDDDGDLCTCSSTDDGATWRASNIIDLGGAVHHDGAFEPN